MKTKYGRRINVSKLSTAVYRLFDKHNVLLYVGVSYNPDARVARHRKKPWGSRIAEVKVLWYPDRPTAMHVEAMAIRDESPLFNRAWTDPEAYTPSGPLVGLDIEQAEFEVVSALCEHLFRTRHSRLNGVDVA